MFRKVSVVSLLILVAWAFGASPERDAYDKAKGLIDKEYQAHVLFIYGTGTPKKIETWDFSFYDPASSTRAKSVVIKEGKVDLLKPSERKHPRDDAFSFDPTQSKVRAETALKTAKQYAEQNNIAYNGARVLYRRSEAGLPPAWTVELRNENHSSGFVKTSAEDGSFAGYQTPAEKESKGFAEDVEDTFLGIGADLEEFFTGERTVDKD